MGSLPQRRWGGVLAPFRRTPSPAPDTSSAAAAADFDSPAPSQRSAHSVVSVSSPGVEASPFAPASGVIGDQSSPRVGSAQADTPSKTNYTKPGQVSPS